MQTSYISQAMWRIEEWVMVIELYCNSVAQLVIGKWAKFACTDRQKFCVTRMGKETGEKKPSRCPYGL